MMPLPVDDQVMFLLLRKQLEQEGCPWDGKRPVGSILEWVRDLIKENRDLIKENGDLKEENWDLEEDNRDLKEENFDRIHGGNWEGF